MNILFVIYDQLRFLQRDPPRPWRAHHSDFKPHYRGPARQDHRDG